MGIPHLKNPGRAADFSDFCPLGRTTLENRRFPAVLSKTIYNMQIILCIFHRHAPSRRLHHGVTSINGRVSKKWAP